MAHSRPELSNVHIALEYIKLQSISFATKDLAMLDIKQTNRNLKAHCTE